MRNLRVALWPLVAALLISGCTGSPDATSSGGDPFSPTPTETSPTPTEDTNDSEVYNPFHTHDYWNGRQSYFLFSDWDGLVIGESGGTLTQDGMYGPEAFFTTESDGNDEHGASADHEDTVFQATGHLTVKLSWDNSADKTKQIPGLQFSFHPASTTLFFEPVLVRNDQEFTITLAEPEWADLAHQLDTSRWAFKVQIYDPSMESAPYPVHQGAGTITVTMKAFRSGSPKIAGPHPYFFLGGPNRPAGEFEFTNSKTCFFVNNTERSEPVDVPRPGEPVYQDCRSGDSAAGPLEGLKPEPRKIVPWETTKLVVDMYYNFTDENTKQLPQDIGMKFHDAQFATYRSATPTAEKSGPGHKHYEIPVTEAMSDSPYADRTDWRYGIFPIFNGDPDLGGAFSVKVHFVLVAVKEGDTSARGNR